MIKVYKDTKVYVHCPAGVVTGGAELLHQIVDILRNNNIESYIVYYGDSEKVIPDDYKCYNIAVISYIEDVDTNVEIIYEGRFDLASVHSKIQKILWWLSVDNFYLCSQEYLSLNDLMKWDFKMFLKAFLRRTLLILSKKRKSKFFGDISLKKLRDMNVIHGYQSEYAQNFLQGNGFEQLVALKDFINIEHINGWDEDTKEDIVLYNPKKGINFTKKIIAASPDIKWIALEGMSRTQLRDVMAKAKVYVDFGYHPGKDRLPRECAMNGCCIITGKRGSAKFFEDIAISRKYKFDDKKSSVPSIVKCIKGILNNYNNNIKDFQYYRQMIVSEEKAFVREVLHIFTETR